MRFLSTLLVCGVMFSASQAFSQEKKTVTRATGKQVVAVVGDCVSSYERDINNNLVPRVDLAVTYCKQFVTYEAVISGKFWNQKESKIDGTEKYSDKLEIDTSSFEVPAGVTINPDQLYLIEMDLRQKCAESRKTLTSLIAPNNCAK